jgi:transposase
MLKKPKYRKPYPPESRRERVALYAGTDRTLGEIAGDLGVSRESLRLWVQQAQIWRGERDGLTGDEREEVRELRPRVLLLEQGAGDPEKAGGLRLGRDLLQSAQAPLHARLPVTGRLREMKRKKPPNQPLSTEAGRESWVSWPKTGSRPLDECFQRL